VRLRRTILIAVAAFGLGAALAFFFGPRRPTADPTAPMQPDARIEAELDRTIPQLD